jgi:hypothetical protein
MNHIAGVEKILNAHFGEGEGSKSEKKGKVKFNPSHPEHISKFKQLDKEFKGNKQKVNEALAREFSI